MATLPPQGMSEADYVAIEAAVTETVRGRWFLNEFARRNRTVELRQILEAMGRIEGVVTAGQAALPPADPSIRLLMQRIKEIAGQLDTLSYELREAGVDERFAASAEKQARAVSGLMRGPGAVRPPAVPHAPVTAPALPAEPSRQTSELREAALLRLEDADQSPAAPSLATSSPAKSLPAKSLPAKSLPAKSPATPDARPPETSLATVVAKPGTPARDPRLAILAPLDDLPLEEKLALFA